VPNVKAKHPDLPHREIFKMAAERVRAFATRRAPRGPRRGTRNRAAARRC
jgi:hypothetical protein